MDQTSEVSTSRTALPPGPFTVAEYYRLAETGVLHQDDRVELIEGELVWMSPANSPHAGTVTRLVRLLSPAVAGRAVLSIQNPVRLDDDSEPEPDVAVLVPRDDDYITSHPQPGEVLLLIEVANSSRAYDRGRKRSLYAGHGIAECWIVDIDAGNVEVCRGPGPNGYASEEPFSPGAMLTIQTLPGIDLPVAEIFR